MLFAIELRAVSWRHRRESNPRLLARQASTLRTELRRLALAPLEGFEPSTPRAVTACSRFAELQGQWSRRQDSNLRPPRPGRGALPTALQRDGGDGRSPTDAFLLARQALWRLSYVPDARGVPGRTRTGICSLRGCRPVPLDDGNTSWLCHTELSKSAASRQPAERSPPAKSGTPPGIRTRRNVFLRHARMPLPPAGQKKARSACAVRARSAAVSASRR